MKKRILFLLALFAAWFVVFAIQKPAFMLYNHTLAADATFSEWIQVILHGMKLDATMAGYLTVLPLLFILGSVWLPGIWLKKCLRVYYLVMAFLTAGIFAIDLGLYGFWGFRLDTTVFFYLQSSVKDSMASVPMGLFFLLSLVFLIYTYGIYWFFNRWILPHTPESMVRRRLLGSLTLFLFGGLMFIPIRGGVTTSTANVGMVYFSQKQFLNHAAINPGFSLLTSISKQQDFASQFDFFPEEERKAIYETVTPVPAPFVANTDTLLQTTRPNILLILLESFSANAIEVLGGEKGVTPNINRLSEEGVLFTRMYANSFRTDRGIVSVLNAYLAQPTTSIMKYPAKSQTLPSLAKSLQKEGYVSDMLYGGDINFTNMQSYFFSSGYNKITADRDFPLTSRLSKWGANDDVTFTWLYNSIEKRQNASPWLCTYLTLSSHEPFEVPYQRLQDPYLNSVAFTDSCLGLFIDKIKKTPVWDNLLVILVSDHGFRYPADVQDYEPRRYHIPMLWLGGAVKEPKKIDTYTNQTDLIATLLGQMNLPSDEFIFSKNVFYPAHPQYAFYTYNNGFAFIDSTGMSVYNNENNKLLLNEPEQGSDIRVQKGKALLQTLYDDLGNR
ncbi:alkaline phosphatase family protein [Parabacteroides sp. 52]|uniref:LTA synthase family protein n=1 Tax=unclassified Parabacteroides TaxID=2649774 RepID=UPI0013D783B4|nr:MULTISPECIES: alkaline phosphatase family protein [unclassified Parabacteroides]MDH6534600.1 phosphoglycerol transferase MdoB-like AlkP superfamily enzyme [Parabacteroides sp. PM5-20]NDV55168.1 alkaline phosphatase family protein [Parabacteroides sp. 52]